MTDAEAWVRFAVAALPHAIRNASASSTPSGLASEYADDMLQAYQQRFRHRQVPGPLVPPTLLQREPGHER